MAKRRSDAEIADVNAMRDRSMKTALAIGNRVNPDENDDARYVSVSAFPIWEVKAEYQKDCANTLIVSYKSKDPVVIERVARAIKAALAEEGQ